MGENPALKQLKTGLKRKTSRKPGEKELPARPLGPRPRFGPKGPSVPERVRSEMVHFASDAFASDKFGS